MDKYYVEGSVASVGLMIVVFVGSASATFPVWPSEINGFELLVNSSAVLDFFDASGSGVIAEITGNTIDGEARFCCFKLHSLFKRFLSEWASVDELDAIDDADDETNDVADIVVQLSVFDS